MESLKKKSKTYFGVPKRFDFIYRTVKNEFHALSSLFKNCRDESNVKKKYERIYLVLSGTFLKTEISEIYFLGSFCSESKFFISKNLRRWTNFKISHPLFSIHILNLEKLKIFTSDSDTMKQTSFLKIQLLVSQKQNSGKLKKKYMHILQNMLQK